MAGRVVVLLNRVEGNVMCVGSIYSWASQVEGTVSLRDFAWGFLYTGQCLLVVAVRAIELSMVRAVGRRVRGQSGTSSATTPCDDCIRVTRSSL